MQIIGFSMIVCPFVHHFFKGTNLGMIKYPLDCTPVIKCRTRGLYMWECICRVDVQPSRRDFDVTTGSMGRVQHPSKVYRVKKHIYCVIGEMCNIEGRYGPRLLILQTTLNYYEMQWKGARGRSRQMVEPWIWISIWLYTVLNRKKNVVRYSGRTLFLSRLSNKEPRERHNCRKKAHVQWVVFRIIDRSTRTFINRLS